MIRMCLLVGGCKSYHYNQYGSGSAYVDGFTGSAGEHIWQQLWMRLNPNLSMDHIPKSRYRRSLD